jgi:1-deoxy-D-xylulose-5-phosphate synthase
VSIRYSKGVAREVPADQVGSGLRGRQVRTGRDVCIVAVGRMVEAAEDAALLLEQQGIAATVWDARVVKPLDPAMIEDAAGHPLVVTVEDGVREGGAGAMVADAVRAIDPRMPVTVLGVPVAYIPQGKPAQILSDLGLDGPGISASVAEALRAVTPTDAGVS